MRGCTRPVALRLPAKWKARILKSPVVPVLKSLLQVLHLKDPFTSVHCLEVGRYAALLASACERESAEALTAYWCAVLHDIGKVGIPEAILRKPAPLTPLEFKVMQRHPEMGRDILEPLVAELGEPVLEGVLCHHERVDGRGYPRGLPASRIPLVARITGVCDAWHAMTVERDYRPAKPADVAVAELVRCAERGLLDRKEQRKLLRLLVVYAGKLIGPEEVDELLQRVEWIHGWGGPPVDSG